MNEEDFVEVLKKIGYTSAHIENDMVTIDLVNVSKEEVKKTYMNVKIFANKVGYKHSYRVCLLEENNG